MPKYLCLQRSLAGWKRRASLARPNAGDVRPVRRLAAEVQEEPRRHGGKARRQGRLATSDPAPDGPFVEIKELVGGYMIVSAESLDQAIDGGSRVPGARGPRLWR